VSHVDISLPLDHGFLRRECPNCLREFKWHHGPTDDRPADAVDPDQYTCPYCGMSADHDAWWTEIQLKHMRQAAVAEVSDEIGRAFRGSSRNSRSGGIHFSYKPGKGVRAPLPLDEADDMATVEPPCHPYEPFKVLEHWSEPFHCIVCGRRFVA
jgi:hypothetical protein